MKHDDKHQGRKRLLLAPAQYIPNSEVGKLPPQAVDLEEAVLGAILLEDEAFHDVADMLSPDVFYKEQNGRICQAILSLKNRGEPADILTVTQELKRTGELEFVGGAYYVSSVTQRIASSANIEFHMRVVLEKYLCRNIIRASTESIREAYEEGGDPIEVLEKWERSLMEITEKLYVTKTMDSAGLLDQVIKDNEILTSKEGAISGVTTGHVDLDRVTSGWQKSDMITVAARPGMGKTALIVGFAKAAVKVNDPVAIFSLEMSAVQLYKRLCSHETEIPLDMILRQGMDPDTVNTLNRDMAALRGAPLYIDDTPALPLTELRRRARKLKREKKIKLIIIDYLQLMRGSGDKKGNREQEVSEISGGIKALAKELDIPIIALSQLSRQVENRPGASKRPQLSDLRDSGSIEQDSDMVIFIFRPEYYGLQVDENNESTFGAAEIIIAKNRHGSLDTILLRWLPQFTKFIDKGAQPFSPPPAASTLVPNNDFL